MKARGTPFEQEHASLSEPFIPDCVVRCAGVAGIVNQRDARVPFDEEKEARAQATDHDAERCA